MKYASSVLMLFALLSLIYGAYLIYRHYDGAAYGAGIFSDVGIVAVYSGLFVLSGYFTRRGGPGLAA